MKFMNLVSLVCIVVLTKGSWQNILKSFLQRGFIWQLVLIMPICMQTPYTIVHAPTFKTGDTHICRRNGMRIAHPPLSMPSLWPLSFMSQVGNDAFQ